MLHELLKWYQEMGIDEAIADEPVNNLGKKAEQPAVSPQPKPRSAALLSAPKESIASARQAAEQCTTVEALRAAVEAFEGCALKRTANKTVFCDGNPEAEIMLIGEAPGASEDMQGVPFCGESGKLLDMILATIGLKRESNLYISNCIFWRPPGNRAPTPEELSICLPFVERHIAFIRPKLLILAGSTAVADILQSKEPITRVRQRMHEYSNPYLDAPIPVAVLFHPSYLLRQPSQKKQAWFDLLKIKHFIQEKGIKL